MPTNFRTPPAGTPTSGQAIPLPPQYAALNTPENPHAGMEKYIDDFYHSTGHIPDGWKVELDHVVKEEPAFLYRHPWLFPVMGIGAGVGLSAAGVGGAGAAASETLGPSTGANMAATSAATTAPESIAAGGGSTAGTAGAAGAGGAAAKVGSKFIDSPLAGAALSGGLGALENLFAPRRNSFADGSATDPRNIMKAGLAKTNDLFGSLSSQLKAGVTLPSARVGNPPSFSGPSLPMNFGVTGSDPAQMDPSLQHLGFNDPRQPQPAGDPTNPTSSALAAFRMLGVKV